MNQYSVIVSDFYWHRYSSHPKYLSYIQITSDMLDLSGKYINIEFTSPFVSSGKFKLIKNDNYCYNSITYNYANYKSSPFYKLSQYPDQEITARLYFTNS